jgi:DnaJ-domain-containing protein 1
VQKQGAQRKTANLKSYDELLHLCPDAEELEEFRLEIKEKLLKKLEQEEKRMKQGIKDQNRVI